MPILARLFRLHASQVIHQSLDASWEFFSDPRNLRTITPPALRLDPIGELPATMHPGMIVTYKVRPLLGVPILWVTEITRVEPKRLFIDEQRFGPYRFWHHQHWLHPVGEGRVRVEDIIHYALPLSFLTTPFHGLLVKKQLSGIFNYRSEVLSERFGSDEELTLQFT